MVLPPSFFGRVGLTWGESMVVVRRAGDGIEIEHTFVCERRALCAVRMAPAAGAGVIESTRALRALGAQGCGCGADALR